MIIFPRPDYFLYIFIGEWNQARIGKKTENEFPSNKKMLCGNIKDLLVYSWKAIATHYENDDFLLEWDPFIINLSTHLKIFTILGFPKFTCQIWQNWQIFWVNYSKEN